MWLVVGLLVVVLAIGSLAVLCEQVRIGNRVFSGPTLTIGARLQQDDIIRLKACLPCSGDLLIFYQGGPGMDEHLILSNLKNQGDCYHAGMADILLPMLYVTGNEQKLRFLFSTERLLNADLCGVDGNSLSVREIEERGLWRDCNPNFLWVGEITIPKVFSPVEPYRCSIKVRDWNCCLSKPVPCCYSFRVRPLIAPCCSSPSPCAAIFWWLLMGILVH